MIGDRADMVRRMRAVLPARWFADSAPVLDALLSGIGAVWAATHEQLAFVRAQTRIATASGSFLDMVAADFFGTRLRRGLGQDDASLRRVIRLELLRERGTRAAVEGVLRDLTGRTPAVFEPMRPADTRAWGIASGWGVAGGWGSLGMPFQCLVTAYRPLTGGVAGLDGWGGASGGWGGGAIGYASMAMVAGRIEDQQIAAAVAGVMPVAATAWLRISN